MSDSNLPPADAAVQAPAPAAEASPAAEPSRRRRGLGVAIVLALLGAVVGGLAGFRSTPPLYRCEGLVYIAPSLPTPQDPAGVNVLPMFNGFVAFQVQLMESLQAAYLAVETKTWQQTGEGTSPTAIDRFVERRSIVHSPDTQHILVRFVDRKPEVAVAGVHALLEAYEKLAVEESARDDRLMFVTSQAEVVTASLKDVEEHTRKLTAEYGGPEGLELRHRASIEQLLAAEAELAKVQGEIREQSKTQAQASATMTTLAAREAALGERLAVLRAQAQELGKIRVEVERLRGEALDLNRKRGDLKALRDQLSAQLLGKGRIQIADQGQLPNSPFQDRRPRHAAVGAALGAAAGALLALLFGRRRRRNG
jgi:hypothetical protein